MTSVTTPPQASAGPKSCVVLTRGIPAAADALLVAARQGLAEAQEAGVPRERYSLAHLSALRAAAAVLAARARPASGRRSRPTSAWRLLIGVAPELGEWAEFFAASATKRAAAEAGRPVVSQREADDLLRDADRFLAAVEATLGLTARLPLPVAG
jgi:hypothetical protein